MRRIRIAIFTVALFAAVFAANAGFAMADAVKYADVVSALNKKLDEFNTPTKNWKYREKCDEKCFLPDIDEELKWKTAGPGFYWPEAFQTFWFRRSYTVPEQVSGRNIAGAKITMTMNVSDSGEIYVNGKKAEGNNETGAVISEKAVPGEKFIIGVKVSNGTWPGAYLGSQIDYSVFNDTKARTRNFIERIKSGEQLLQFSPEKDRWTAILDKSAAKVDVDSMLKNNDPAYFASLDAALRELEELSPLFKEYTLYMLGYSHIDLAWLWDKREGEDVTKNTLVTVFGLMKEYPEWIYSQSQAHGFKWMEDDYPQLFKQIKDYYKQGRFELIGGTWSEHDSNLPGGEGFVRQFLYGKRYFREKFNKDIVIAWTPDSFGYNWNLPQILVKSGMKGFLTQKLGSNETTRFPYNVFWWEGADGSKILTYFPPSGYADSVIRSSLISQLATFKSKHNLNENFVIYGVGDHGGGLTRGHLDRAFEIKNDIASPKVEFTTAEKYFAHLLDLDKSLNFPAWNDELYLEHHRGTYTSQANNKKHNRRTEQLLMDSEKFSSIAASKFGYKYPAKRLFDSGWYFVLLNHMHDILPGSGIRKVYEDSDKDYAAVYKTTSAVLKESLGTIAAKVNTLGAGEPLIVFNPLSWKRDAIIEEPFAGLGPKSQVVDSKGNELLSQVTSKNGKPHILFVAKNLPPMGYEMYRVFPAGTLRQVNDAKPSALKADTGAFENSLVKVSFDQASGDIISLFDKKLNRELLVADKKSNLVQAFKDTQNAWEIQSSEPVPVGEAADIQLIENGPVRATIKLSRKIGESTAVKYVSLYDNDPMTYGRIDLDWQTHNVTLKLAFFLNLINEDAWFEIPYAAISRKTQPKTPAEKAKFEVSAHNWVDYTDKDSSAGVSLLNNSKYGFDIKDNVMRMTLLRSPISPDPEADQGSHSISYALYPHPGDWRAADTSRKGYEFNYTPYVVHPAKHKGQLPESMSFFSSNPENIALTAIKKAEDGDGWIIRFVETEGRATTATIQLPWQPRKAVETNLIEDKIDNPAKVELNGNKLSVKLGKYEIMTLKITL